MAHDILEGEVAHSRDEMDPPDLLLRALGPLTRQAFLEAGLVPGMRVLDACSGGGDAAFVAREIVGPDGQVTGFDQLPGAVAYANERAAFRGLNNVEFVEADLADLPFGRDFDAIVGRLVLMYRPDPVGDLRALVGCLRPGGLVVFQELDVLSGRTVPPASLVDNVRDWLLDLYTQAGLELEMGPKLYATLKAAGLDAPRMRVDGFIGGAESICPELIANVARTLLPQAEALGVMGTEELQIDTLEQRLRADLVTTGGVMSTPLLISAWTRLPG